MEKNKEVAKWVAQNKGATESEVEENTHSIEVKFVNLLNKDRFVEMVCALTYGWWDGLQAPVYDNGTGLSFFYCFELYKYRSL